MNSDRYLRAETALGYTTPVYHLTSSECMHVRSCLAKSMNLHHTKPDLEFFKELGARQTFLPRVYITDGSFILEKTFAELRVEPEPQIYVNWAGFDNIDKVSTNYFSRALND